MLGDDGGVNRFEPWYSIYRRARDILLKRGYARWHADRTAKNRVATEIAIAVAEAVGALE